MPVHQFPGLPRNVIAHHEVQRIWRHHHSPPPQPQNYVPFHPPDGGHYPGQHGAVPHPDPELMHGLQVNPTLPNVRYGPDIMFGANVPQQHYWALYGQPQMYMYPQTYPQMYGGAPPQQNFYEGQALDYNYQPMYGNIHYEGYILPDHIQGAYIQQIHPQDSLLPNYPVGGVHAQVDYSAALLERFHNAHGAAGHFYQSQNHGQADFDDMQFNVQVHQNIMQLQNEQPVFSQQNIGMDRQAQNQVAEMLHEQQTAKLKQQTQLQQELDAVERNRWKEEQDSLLDEALHEHGKETEEQHNQDEERRQQADNFNGNDPIHPNPPRNPGSPPSPPSPSPPPPPVDERPYREPIAKHYLGQMNIECPKCHALHFASEKLSNSSMRNPKFGICCLQGQVDLPAFPEWPRELKALFHDPHDEQKFIENVRQYNSALSFTSLGVKIHTFAGGPPAAFRIHGALHHLMGSLVPPEGNSPSYAQLYIYDAQQATELRHQRNQNLRPDILRELHDILSRHHPYAATYKNAMQIVRELPPEQHRDMQIRLHLQPGTDARRYNLPTADEIAVVVPGDGSENVQDSRDIVIQYQGGALRRISHLHQSYSSLHYVLLFPRGENGWHLNMPLQQQEGQNTRAKKVTQILYYAYRLFTCPTVIDSNNIFYGGRLFQQFVCDAWASIEQSNLTWIFHNQKKLRSDLYQGLQDLAARDANPDLRQQGRSVILPSSHTGSPRFMQQILQDSLAICRDCKKPDLFLTMTANSNWCEIQDNLLPGQRAVDRPDLVARVFFQKKEALLKKVRAGYFGAVAGLVYTIEYQKRGLPHMHLLIFLQEQDKIHTPEQADSFISAQIPDAEETPQLYSAVSKYMLHGPCKPDRCLENGKCKKHFPKKYCGQTTMNEDGYPDYARPNNGRTIEKPQRGGINVFTNADVVPHPPELLVEFDCHINLEVCATIKAVKYVHKYIYKGPDRATLEIQGPVDEVKAYLDSRYISAMEAAWRIFEFPMHLEYPSVYRLSVHLPDRQLIHFDAADDIQEVLERAADRDTTLTGWFKANLEPDLINAGANDLLYQDFPKKFVWVAKTHKWKIRQSGRAIGRMYTIPPTAGECFFLRLLLTVVKG